MNTEETIKNGIKAIWFLLMALFFEGLAAMIVGIAMETTFKLILTASVLSIAASASYLVRLSR